MTAPSCRKRHGAVSVMQYDADGFLPEALFNYLARLGWIARRCGEVLGGAMLIDWFDLEHVSRRAGPVQHSTSLLWLNGEYMKELPTSAARRAGRRASRRVASRFARAGARACRRAAKGPRRAH